MHRSVSGKKRVEDLVSGFTIVGLTWAPPCAKTGGPTLLTLTSQGGETYIPVLQPKVIKAKDTKKSLGCVRYREAIEVLWSSDRHWQWPWQPGGSVLWLLEPSVLSVHINHTSPFHALCNRDLPRPPMQIALTVQPTSSGWG